MSTQRAATGTASAMNSILQLARTRAIPLDPMQLQFTAYLCDVIYRQCVDSTMQLMGDSRWRAFKEGPIVMSAYKAMTASGYKPGVPLDNQFVLTDLSGHPYNYDLNSQQPLAHVINAVLTLTGLMNWQQVANIIKVDGGAWALTCAAGEQVITQQAISADICAQPLIDLTALARC